ncbi:MAG: DUF2203 domain-containing protein [Polyangiaceae bacterium]|nr:DUF2203 domain-containing protein [Polyangiaceae bacterium]
MEHSELSIEEANALVPKLAELVGRQLARRSDIETRLRVLASVTGEVPSEITTFPNDAPDLRKTKVELIQRITDYQDGWKEVESLGCVVKDPRIGLVDFYGRIEGKLVYLCWKHGETEIAHYHALDEGYTARKSIRDTVRKMSIN